MFVVVCSSSHSRQVFKDATLFFSRGTPSLLMVILAMDHLDEEMTRMSQDSKYDTSLRVALGLAKKTINMYYDKTDMSDTYRISMGESYDI